jgi:hypothetical protein
MYANGRWKKFNVSTSRDNDERPHSRHHAVAFLAKGPNRHFEGSGDTGRLLSGRNVLIGRTNDDDAVGAPEDTLPNP